MSEPSKIQKVRVIDEDYTYSLLSLIVGKKVKDGNQTDYEEVGMVKRNHKEVWLKAYCDEGEYIGFVENCLTQIETPWKRCANEFGFSIYGPDDMPIRMNCKEAMDEDFIHKLLLQRCLQRGPEFEQVAEVRYRYELDNGGFGYFFFENKSPYQIYYVAIELSEPMLNCKFSRLFSPSGSLRRPHAAALPRAWRKQADRHPEIWR